MLASQFQFPLAGGCSSWLEARAPVLPFPSSAPSLENRKEAQLRSYRRPKQSPSGKKLNCNLFTTQESLKVYLWMAG